MLKYGMQRELDEVDSNILAELKRDARAPYTIISSKLGILAVTVQRRVERLLEDGVVSLEVIPNLVKLGYKTAASIGMLVERAQLESVVRQLQHNEHVVFMALTAGRYDLILWTAFKSPGDLADFTRMTVGTIDGVRRLEIMINLKRSKRAFDELHTFSGEPASIDLLDKRVISVLSNDVRISYPSLAKEAGVSIPTARLRVQRLIHEGIIALSAISHPFEVGCEISAHLGLRVRLSKVDTVIKALEPNPAVKAMSYVAGQFDIMIWALFKKPEEMTNFVVRDLGAAGGVEGSETFLNLRIPKVSYRNITRLIVEQ